MADNKQHIFKPQFAAELNIESIISAPLIAASKANVMMLAGQTKFLLDYCFNKQDDVHQPVMVEMLLTQPVINPTKKPSDPEYISIEKMAFQVPLLCLIPLNSLAVDKVNVDFDLEITSVGSYQSNIDVVERKAVLNGRVASATQPSEKNSHGQYTNQSFSRLKVNINASCLPLPKGVLAILDLYTKTIQPVSEKSNVVVVEK